MASVDEMQKSYEARLEALTRELGAADGDSRWALVRALVHHAVHFAAERKAAEFCALATYLAEMTGHAHKLMHGDKAEAAHADVVH